MTVLAIGPLLPADVPAALRLSTQAGWNQVATDWLRLIALWPDGCFAGRLDGRLVATATLAVYPPDLAWVGMMLVDASCRGQGVGGAMMDAVLAAADRAGIRCVGLDATDLGRPLYVKRGFVDAIGIGRRVLAAADRPADDDDGSAQALRDEDWTSVLDLDHDAFGGDRSRLLARLRGESGAAACVVRDASRVIGFGFRRPGRGAEQIGPVVARSPAEAAGVVRSLAARGDRAGDVLLDSFHGGELGPWLDRAGFAVSRRLTRMFRGAGATPHRPHAHTHAAAGLELG
jgi:GNAT superfamily N-acetyltransferase